jgi:hypothetical protein
VHAEECPFLREKLLCNRMSVLLQSHNELLECCSRWINRNKAENGTSGILLFTRRDSASI